MLQCMYLQYILAEIHSLFAFINIDTLFIQRCHHIFLSSLALCECQRSFPYTDGDRLARWLPATRTQRSLTNHVQKKRTNLMRVV